MTKLIKLDDLRENHFRDSRTVIVIGFFDGVHLGHKKIIKLCVEKAKKINGISIALTFDKPPLNIIRGEMSKKLITSFKEKINLIKELEVNFIITAKFNISFSKLKPEKFCKEVLLKKLNIGEVFIGEDFHFGHEASGNGYFLKSFFKPYKVNVNVIPLLKLNNIPISSSAIRNFFSKGDIRKVKSLLGRIPQIIGTVVRASGRGKKLGFPTANIDVCEIYVIPKDGVYLGFVNIGESGKSKRLPAIINVGDNPTFKDNKKWIEAHIIDFKNDLYGKEIRIFFVKRLREEIIFEDKYKLIGQLKSDMKVARKYFKKEVN